MKLHKIIDVQDCEFAYVESYEYVISHPIDGYYFKLNDISINVNISFKWIFYAYFFFSSISKTIRQINESEDSVAFFIEEDINYKADYKEHKIFIDDLEICSLDDLKSKIKTEYDMPLFDENTKVRLKLKLNLNDFLLLQNVYIPTLFFTTPENSGK